MPRRERGRQLPPCRENSILNAPGPGHLVAASGHFRILKSSHGKCLTEGFDRFEWTWVPRRFDAEREGLVSELLKSLPNGAKCRVSDSLLQHLLKSVTRRTLRLIRGSGHGGTVIYLPVRADPDFKIESWLRFRVRFTDQDPTRNFRKLIVRLLARLIEIGDSLGLSEITFEDYDKIADIGLSSLNSAVIEFSHLLADLTSVDGAVVLDESMRLVGFGPGVKVMPGSDAGVSPRCRGQSVHWFKINWLTSIEVEEPAVPPLGSSQPGWLRRVG